jgi:hypothetical protein
MTKKFFIFLLLFSLIFLEAKAVSGISQKVISNLQSIFSPLFYFLVRLAIVFFILKIIWAGFVYLFSAGEVTKIGEAREMIVDAIVGIATVLLIIKILCFINPQLTIGC